MLTVGIDMNVVEQSAQAFDRYRGRLFAIAYRMLGSATDAEDIVQEAFVHWLQASNEQVQSPKAYLSTIVVRLCINRQNRPGPNAKSLYGLLAARTHPNRTPPRYG